MSFFLFFLFFWDKVDTAWMEWMAFKNPDDGKPASFNRAETADCFQAVMGTGRVETAGRRF